MSDTSGASTPLNPSPVEISLTREQHELQHLHRFGGALQAPSTVSDVIPGQTSSVGTTETTAAMENHIHGLNLSTGCDDRFADSTGLTAAVNTYQSIVSASLPAGQYLLVAKGDVNFSVGAAVVKWTARLWDGTNELDRVEFSFTGNGRIPFALTDVSVFASAVTLALQIQRDNVSGTQIADFSKYSFLRVG